MEDDHPVVMVTGAAGNVGRALVRRLVAESLRVVAVGRDPIALRRLKQELGASPALLTLDNVDVSSSMDCASAVETVLRQFGRIDGLAHTVGGFAMGSVEETSVDAFDQMFRLNVLTALNVFAAALPEMRRRRRGSFVAVAAGAALRGGKNLSAYSASKSALMRLIESLAEEGKSSGVRANAVLPGTIDTPENRSAMPTADHAGWVHPDEVAAAIAFLLSDASSGVTGAGLSVPGRA